MDRHNPHKLGALARRMGSNPIYIANFKFVNYIRMIIFFIIMSIKSKLIHLLGGYTWNECQAQAHDYSISTLKCLIIDLNDYDKAGISDSDRYNLIKHAVNTYKNSNTELSNYYNGRCLIDTLGISPNIVEGRWQFSYKDVIGDGDSEYDAVRDFYLKHLMKTNLK